MPTDGYMDAAAVPVPDAGDDTLRERLYVEMDSHGWGLDDMECICGWKPDDDPSMDRHVADALLPRIREHIAQAVQTDRERAIYAVEHSRLAEPWGGYEDGINAGLDTAIDVLRGVDQPEPEVTTDDR